MGLGRRARPKKLHLKLRRIRRVLELNHDEMAKKLVERGADRTIRSSYVADFESGRREPSLLALLAYARLAGVSTDVLIDDGSKLEDR